MTFELIKPKDIVLNNTVYTVESITIHNHVKYADAYRRVQGRIIMVESDEIRKELGGTVTLIAIGTLIIGFAIGLKIGCVCTTIAIKSQIMEDINEL